VELFVTTVRPSILSYDYYPFLAARDRPSFFENLRLIRDVAREHSLPFMLIVQAMPHADYRDPTEAELSWQALHALAFGARGLSYFAYWTPVDVLYANDFKFRRGLIEAGRPSEHYAEATRLNGTTKAIAAELSSYRSVDIADARGDGTLASPLGPITSVDGGSITAGLFDDGRGRRAALVVNRDYLHETSVTIDRTAAAGRPMRLVPPSSRWIDAETVLRLPAGGAQLLRWTAHQ
jgi:hypothetical protein